MSQQVSEQDERIFAGGKTLRWNLKDAPHFIAKHIFETECEETVRSWTGNDLTIGQIVVERNQRKSDFSLGGEKDVWIIWVIFRNLLELARTSLDDGGPECKVKECGQIVWQLMARGNFYDVDQDQVYMSENLSRGGGTWEDCRNNLNKRYTADFVNMVLRCMGHEELFDASSNSNSCIQLIASMDARLWASKLIPKDLPLEYQAVYHELITLSKQQERIIPNVFVISDLAKDYDDLAAMILIKELHRLQTIKLKGYVANLVPAHDRTRFGRAALDLLDLSRVPIAEGLSATTKEGAVLDHEFIDAEKNWMWHVPTSTNFISGQELMYEKFTAAAQQKEPITLLLLSSLSDINSYIECHGSDPEFSPGSVFRNVILQGGYEVVDGRIIVRPDAMNNFFDLPAAVSFHKYMESSKIESLVFSKESALAMDIPGSFFQDLKNTGHPLGDHLYRVQEMQEKKFFSNAWHEDPDKRFRPFMDKNWYLRNRTTWWTSGDHPNGEMPLTVEDVWPYLTKIVIYDALAAFGAAGDDVLKQFGLLNLPAAQEKTIHKYTGVREESEHFVNLEQMEIVVKALILGGLLATQQGLKPLDQS